MSTQELTKNVEQALEEIRPFLKADGGDVSLVSIEDNIATVKFQGACSSCNINQMTLKNGVEATIKRFAPQIEKVVNVEA